MSRKRPEVGIKPKRRPRARPDAKHRERVTTRKRARLRARLDALVTPEAPEVASNRVHPHRRPRDAMACQRQRKTRPHGGGIVPPVSMCFPTKDWVSALAC